MISYDTQVLIDNVERICSVPLTQVTYEPLDIVSFANNALILSIVPLMMRARQEYFVKNVTVTPDSTGIFPIPSDAIGDKIEYLMASNSSGIVKIPRIDLGVITSYGSPNTGFYPNNNNSVGTGGFYLEGSEIHLYPSTLLNTYNQTVKIYYFARTLVLAQPSAYGRITSIDLDNDTVEIDNTPTTWAEGTVLNIQSTTPNHFKNIVPSISIVSVSGTTVELSSSLADVSVGDYLCEQGYAAIPQIPPDIFPYLYQLTAAKCMEGLGDTQAMQNAMIQAEAIKIDLVGLTADRVEGQPQKIVSTNRFFNRGLRGGWGRGY